MIDFRPMTVEDLPLGMRLKELAGWNQTEVDWRRIFSLEPDGCFVAQLDGRPVATTTTCVLGSIGWIAMVLVDPPARGQGIGKQLMQHALAYLDRRGVRTARLDATPLGRPVYEKLGFVVEYELTRWEGVSAGTQQSADLQSIEPEQLEALYALDRQVTGTDRRRLLERLYQEQPDAMKVVTLDGWPSGYQTLRIGSRAVQLGPVVAIGDGAGRALCDAAMAALKGKPVFMDIPVGNVPAVRWAESQGLRPQRTLTRMSRGEPVHDQPQQIWASFGPEKG